VLDEAPSRQRNAHRREALLKFTSVSIRLDRKTTAILTWIVPD
jgi:hypothetical protein